MSKLVIFGLASIGIVSGTIIQLPYQHLTTSGEIVDISQDQVEQGQDQSLFEAQPQTQAQSWDQQFQSQSQSYDSQPQSYVQPQNQLSQSQAQASQNLQAPYDHTTLDTFSYQTPGFDNIYNPSQQLLQAKYTETENQADSNKNTENQRVVFQSFNYDPSKVEIDQQQTQQQQQIQPQAQFEVQTEQVQVQSDPQPQAQFEVQTEQVQVQSDPQPQAIYQIQFNSLLYKDSQLHLQNQSPTKTNFSLQRQNPQF